MQDVDHARTHTHANRKGSSASPPQLHKQKLHMQEDEDRLDSKLSSVLLFSCFLHTEISTSQNDVREDLLSVNGNRRPSQFQYSTQKSLSDTEINKSSHVSSFRNKTHLPE